MKCSFCGKDIERGTGTLFVRKTGKVLPFCSMKCEKNVLKLERKPRKLKWTVEGREARAGAKGAKNYK